MLPLHERRRQLGALLSVLAIGAVMFAAQTVGAAGNIDGAGAEMVSGPTLSGSPAPTNKSGPVICGGVGADGNVHAFVTDNSGNQSVTPSTGNLANSLVLTNATIGSGATALAIPVMVDTIIPPTPIMYFGDNPYTDGGCWPCSVPDRDTPIPDSVPTMWCMNGCAYLQPAPGVGFTHIVNQRHADIALAALIPPDAGPLWGNPNTGQVETEFMTINNTQISQNITDAVVYPDAGSAADVPYPDGGSGIDFAFSAEWMCAHHDAGCLIRWSP